MEAKKLREMEEWVHASSCRRAAIVRAFGEELSDKPDACCDNCGLETDRFMADGRRPEPAPVRPWREELWHMFLAGGGAMRRQSEQIKQMTDREVLIHLYITQGLLLLLAGGSSLFLFAREEWRRLWQFELRDVLVYGAGGAAFVLAAEFLAMRYLPDDWHDDGGVNEKIFRGRSIPHLFFYVRSLR